MTAIHNAISGIQSEAVTLTVSLSPTSITTGGAGPLVVSPTVTATPTGGSGAYSYSWTALTPSLIAIDSPSSASTTFSVTLASGEGESGIFRCTATDTLNPSVTGYKNISVTLIRF